MGIMLTDGRGEADRSLAGILREKEYRAAHPPVAIPVPCCPISNPEIDILALPSVPLGGELPDVSTVYFVLEQDEILYIGQAQSLSRRWIQHHKAKELERFPSARIAWYETDDRMRLERKLIVQFSPPLNVTKYRGNGQ